MSRDEVFSRLLRFQLSVFSVSAFRCFPMKIDAPSGCYEKTGGLFYFSRMCSKIRLEAAGKLRADLHEMLGQGFDGRTCRYLGVDYEDVKKRVLAGDSD